MERISVYLKVIEFIGLILLGILVGSLYLILSVIIMVLCSPYLEAYYKMFSQIYMYYLPLSILLASIVFNQGKAFISILTAILTGAYLMYLWAHIDLEFGFF